MTHVLKLIQVGMMFPLSAAGKQYACRVGPDAHLQGKSEHVHLQSTGSIFSSSLATVGFRGVGLAQSRGYRDLCDRPDTLGVH